MNFKTEHSMKGAWTWPQTGLRQAACMVLALGLFLDPARGADDLLLTEFMAVNQTVLADEDGEHPDWIELHNAGTNVVSL